MKADYPLDMKSNAKLLQRKWLHGESASSATLGQSRQMTLYPGTDGLSQRKVPSELQDQVPNVEQSRFGHDIGRVRIHNRPIDSTSAVRSDSIAARSTSPSETFRALQEKAPGLASTINLFDNPESHSVADRLGAFAFSWQGDVFLGGHIGKQGAPSRDGAIRHELIHARQSRNMGTIASTGDLEREASDETTSSPNLASNPNEVMGLWWVIPAAVGLYILLRPKVANAPGPKDKLIQGPTEAQIVGEALAMFAVPAGVAGALTKLGYSAIAGYAISGAASSTAFRGVQDVGSSQFSGVEAYVIDAATGAVIGTIIGGSVRLLGGIASKAPDPLPKLIHLTTPESAATIGPSNPLRGGSGIWALPNSAEQQGTAVRFLRSLIAISKTKAFVRIPDKALPFFTQPTPIGPISAYQQAVGAYRAPAGTIDMVSGQFTASTSSLANITGQFWPYGIDGLIWAGVATGVRLSPSSPDAYRDRGMFSPFHELIRNRPPLSMTERTDGPFVFVDPPIGDTTQPASPLEPFDVLPAANDRSSKYPAIILVSPMFSEDHK